MHPSSPKPDVLLKNLVRNIDFWKCNNALFKLGLLKIVDII
jgi:hypothetical protein